MPKIKIKNLSAEINRRIRLIKTPTSVVEVGEQNGAVFESADYVGICLSPITVPPLISCDGAGQITGLAIGYYVPDGGNQDTWIVAEQVRLKFNNEERFIALDGATPPYTSEYPEIGAFFNQHLSGANGDFNQAPFEGEISFWQNIDPLNPVRFEYELLPTNQTQFRVATFGDNPAHENVTPIFTRACFAPYVSPISCAGAESSVEMAFAIKDGAVVPVNVSFLLDNNPVDLMNNPPPYITKEILNKTYDGEVPVGFNVGAGVLKFTNTDTVPHRIECFTNDFQNIRVLVNHNSTVINLDYDFDWVDVGVCLSPKQSDISNFNAVYDNVNGEVVISGKTLLPNQSVFINVVLVDFVDDKITIGSDANGNFNFRVQAFKSGGIYHIYANVLDSNENYSAQVDVKSTADYLVPPKLTVTGLKSFNANPNGQNYVKQDIYYANGMTFNTLNIFNIAQFWTTLDGFSNGDFTLPGNSGDKICIAALKVFPQQSDPMLIDIIEYIVP